MTSHVGLMIVFALFVSTVFATLMRDTLREQVRFGLRLFAGFIAAALAMGWLMYPFPL
jgi:prepilin signal peptidase PulO-like enzyme (type II secretory pathway)